MKQNLNDFQYKWYLCFEEEYEKSIFGLSFDPYFELEKYETETIPDYVNLYRKNSIFNTNFLSRFIDVIIACEDKARLINSRIQNYINHLFTLTDENLNKSFNKLKIDNESNEYAGCLIWLITIIILCFLLPVGFRGNYSSIFSSFFSSFSNFLAFCFGGLWFFGFVFHLVQLIMNFMIAILFFFFKLFLIFRFHKLLYYFYSFLNKNLHSILILMSLFVK